MSLKRKTPLKRTAMKKKRVKRDWAAALAKVREEGRCRVCADAWRTNGGIHLQAAHTIGREYQDVEVQAGVLLLVEKDAIVPLCVDHHLAYDARKLSLLDKLTMRELRNAIAACKRNGLDARRRLSGGRSHHSERETA